MAKLFRRADLPHLRSTRDGRDRLDLVTDAVPVAARRIRADRIVYHPGGCQIDREAERFLYVMGGEGAVVIGGERLPLDQESVVGLEPGDAYSLEAGPGGLEVLEATSQGEARLAPTERGDPRWRSSR